MIRISVYSAGEKTAGNLGNKELYEIRVEHTACVAAEIGEHIGKIFAGAVGASDGISCRIEAVGSGQIPH